jgi:transposase-like protein
MVYSLDLRKRAVEAVLTEKKMRKEVCAMFGIERTTLSNWLKKAANGDLSRKPRMKTGGRVINDDVLIAYVKANPDAYLDEIAKALGGSKSAVHDAFGRLGIRRKKRPRAIGSATRRYERSTPKR